MSFHRLGRLAALAVCSIFLPLWMSGAAEALPVGNGLSQPSGEAGCISADQPDCAEAPQSWFDLSRGIAVGANRVLVASGNGDRVVSLDRNQATGALTASNDAGDCVAVHPVPDCQDGHDLGSPADIELDKSGKFAYAVASKADSLITFKWVGGKLTQLAEAGCSAFRGDDFNDGSCQEGGVSMIRARDVALSPDQQNIYVAAEGGGGENQPEAINVFSRNVSTGTIGKLPGTAGCHSSNGQAGCEDADGIIGLRQIEVSPDGGNLYALSSESDAITTFARGAGGAITQKTNNVAYCVSADGSDGDCVKVPQLEWANSMYLSRDGRSIYISAVRQNGFNEPPSGALVHLRRDPATGKLSKPAIGPLCWGDLSGCSPAFGRFGGQAVESPDGRSLYVSGVVGITAYSRDTNGVIVPLKGEGSCLFEAPFVAGCSKARIVSFYPELELSPAADRLYTLGISAQGLEAIGNLKRHSVVIGGLAGQ
ncbi:MAG TPA: hypothetical protein VMF31_12950 [Solirubrobacterales bacterium]|nr:hypothetical protein [Solirubrobacterales bacterium]